MSSFMLEQSSSHRRMTSVPASFSGGPLSEASQGKTFGTGGSLAFHLREGWGSGEEERKLIRVYKFKFDSIGTASCHCCKVTLMLVKLLIMQ